MIVSPFLTRTGRSHCLRHYNAVCDPLVAASLGQQIFCRAPARVSQLRHLSRASEGPPLAEIAVKATATASGPRAASPWCASTMYLPISSSLYLGHVSVLLGHVALLERAVTL